MRTRVTGVGGPRMRELIVTENITLDGVIDATEGWFNPAGDDAEIDQSDVEAALREQREAADALLARAASAYPSILPGERKPALNRHRETPRLRGFSVAGL